ncbi:hypothetical protein ATJ88_3273 [Isoptericola jiangsuensis]|uniref:Uncharacterized protein n=1 Tax=Isoptericola jiangsuensis TaxID=548579 RepID=A0A2A9F168_9MICO|nr:hypothetical protein [Isoptericola jiangsuensis]PFG44546.1 hypothetical protein ATJ88_3273 [Isoptericola jiangsuensis]
MTDDTVEIRWRFRRRTARVAGVVAGVAVLVGTWWVVSAQGVVETGSSSWSRGYPDGCLFPDDDMWALYAGDEDVVAVQTVGNPAPWPVTVVSHRPDVFRFGGPFDEFTTFPPSDGVPPAPDETNDRATIPAGGEVVLWIVEPFAADGEILPGSYGYNTMTGIDGADLQVWSLGFPHDTHVEFRGRLWQSELDLESAAFQRQLAEMCVDDE